MKTSATQHATTCQAYHKNTGIQEESGFPKNFESEPSGYAVERCKNIFGHFTQII